MIGKPNRDGFTTITPYLFAKNVDAYLAFLETAFDAKETYRATGGGGGAHLELQIGESRLMVGETDSPPAGAAIFLYVQNVPAVFDHAVASGAQPLMKPAKDQFQEEVGAAVTDPEGHQWFIASHGPRSVSPG